MLGLLFTEVNPDKGTETRLRTLLFQKLWSMGLQKLTPIRGRKLFHRPSNNEALPEFTEVNPDKGTETSLKIFLSSLLLVVYRS